MEIDDNATSLTNKVLIREGVKEIFANWQAQFNSTIVSYPGFVSLEILSSLERTNNEWTLMQRFNTTENLSRWFHSSDRQKLMNELKPFLAQGGNNVQLEFTSSDSKELGSVTEIFVTEVSPDKEEAYRQWMAKIHQVEATFPGFRGVHVQAPYKVQGKNWITLLQFDTQANLDVWLSSPERRKVLQESESIIASLENHRLISAYSGWFSSLAKTGKIPAAWKQTMIVLLVLFPIVIIQMRYLSPLLKDLHPVFGTFISNAMSVLLIAWPMTPIAIWFLSWWLSPREPQTRFLTILGTCFVVALYLFEIAIFWLTS